MRKIWSFPSQLELRLAVRVRSGHQQAAVRSAQKGEGNSHQGKYLDCRLFNSAFGEMGMRPDEKPAIANRGRANDDGIATAFRRLGTCFLLLTLILLGGIFAHAFQAADPDPAAAKSILARMSAANGWGKGAIPRDAVITGAITRHFSDGDASTPFTIKMRGREQYRYAEDGSPVLLVANGPAGAMVGAD